MTLNRDELQGDDAPDEKRRGKVARARIAEERAPSRADPPETLASEFGSVGSIADLVSSNPEHEFTRGGPDSALPEGFARYNRHGKLGSGGMGDVVVARDLSVGRDVAMKMVRERLTDKADIKSRFLLEARVQGQLEHPSVVPVYDLGVSPDRQLYFTMKRVRGTTLEEVLDRLDRGDEEAAVKFGRRRLLADFSKLCLAVHYVHERGVLHRDLKPANVMLGDYGEVYLLDWGLAKVLAAGDAAPPPVDLETTHRQDATPPPAVDPHMAGSAPAHTHFGALVGTPGYMAPEQILKVEPLDRRADVYGLGAILFELLTGERMHRARGTQALVESTLSEGTERRASVRAPELEVPPELEALVLRATASEREERLESAKALHEALERYLDGDRDQVARRAAAAEAVNQAQTRVAAAIDGGDDDARVEALRQLGHALALDPENVEALRSLVALLTEPPPTMPEAVADELTELEEHQTRGAGKVGAIAFGSLNLYLPLMLWMGVVRWWPLLLFSALTTLTALVSLFVSRLEHPRTPHAMAVLVAGLATASVSSSIFGPFVLAPSIVAVITLLFSLNHPPEWRGRIIGLGIGATMLPAVLEWSGVLPTSMAFSEAGVTLLPRVTHFPPVPALLLLVIGNLAVVVTAGAAMAPIRQELDDAQARVRTTAWQLRQLVPEEVDRQTTAVRAERPLRAPSRRTGGSASSRRGRGTRPGTGANLARTRDSGASSATGRSAAPVEGGAGGSEESEPGAGRRDAGATLIDSGY